MSFIQDDNGCCGANFEKNNISLFGLISFTIPLYYFSLLLTILFYFFKFISPRLYKIIETLNSASINLIREQSIYSKFKCEVSAKLFNISPRLSGYFYKFYNLFILTFIFLIFVIPISGFIYYVI